MTWQPIEIAPKDGTKFVGRRTRVGENGRPLDVPGKLYHAKRTTWWGKTSHLTIIGWCWGRHVENVALWNPTHWRPIHKPPETSP